MMQDIKKIKLTKGFETIVDSEDFESLNQWKWQYNKQGYVVRTLNRKAVLMHRLVNRTPIGLVTDHINRNKLDNRKINLRTVTQSQNLRNQGLHPNNTSGYRGVGWHDQNENWRATITVNYKLISLGSYKTIQGAWLARRLGERIYFAGHF